MIALFSAALFCSSFLLFWCQPMLGKMLLPLLGGTPAVWITSMFFFQLLLLAGYLYAHLLTTRLPLRLQMGTHILLVSLALMTLPLAISPRLAGTVPDSSQPFLWLLWALLATAGPSFFVLSASASLLQRWFSCSRHPAAGDPYFLYATSNLGSLLALVAYPLLLEPLLTLRVQRRAWMGGYLLLGLLFLAVLFVAASWSVKNKEGKGGGHFLPRPSPLPRSRTLRWLFLAFVPSSLMLGVTAFMTNDVASFPLLWVVPLAVYLVTYLIAFSRRPLLSGRLAQRLLPGAAIVLAFAILIEIRNPVWFLYLAALAFLFFASLACHSALAADRPQPGYLTRFYLFISLGGALGGFFNSLIAPLLFRGIGELPVVMALAPLAFFDPRAVGSGSARKWDLVLPLGVGAVTAAMAVGIPRFTLEPYQLWMFVIFGVPLVVVYTFLHRPLRFSLGLAAVFAASLLFQATGGSLLYSERNFFGTLRVARFADGPTLRFFHGSTLHGMQFLSPAQKSEPLAYFHRLGPFGRIMEEFNSRPGPHRVGIIGVGVGAMLAYALPDQQWTYYEIDPDIARLAKRSGYFTFFRDTRAARVDVVVGDARQKMEKAPAGQYDLVILDAFSSDVVPTHLLTREAFALYLEKLAPGGFIAAHISSQNLNLAPVVAATARSLGLFFLFQKDDRVENANRPIPGKFPSTWAVLARLGSDLGWLASSPGWRGDEGLPRRRVWTDDYSNILSVLNWF